MIGFALGFALFLLAGAVHEPLPSLLMVVGGAYIVVQTSDRRDAEARAAREAEVAQRRAEMDRSIERRERAERRAERKAAKAAKRQAAQWETEAAIRAAEDAAKAAAEAAEYETFAATDAAHWAREAGLDPADVWLAIQTNDKPALRTAFRAMEMARRKVEGPPRPSHPRRPMVQ